MTCIVQNAVELPKQFSNKEFQLGVGEIEVQLLCFLYLIYSFKEFCQLLYAHEFVSRLLITYLSLVLIFSNLSYRGTYVLLDLGQITTISCSFFKTFNRLKKNQTIINLWYQSQKVPKGIKPLPPDTSFQRVISSSYPSRDILCIQNICITLFFLLSYSLKKKKQKITSGNIHHVVLYMICFPS